MDGEGENRAGDEGLAELGDGGAVLEEADEGAIDPFELPPMVRVGWEGVDRADGEQRAKLGDGFATPVGAGEGAINPTERAEVGSGARPVGMVAHDDAGPPFG